MNAKAFDRDHILLYYYKIYFILFEKKKIKDTIAYSKTVLAKEALSQHASGFGAPTV